MRKTQITVSEELLRDVEGTLIGLAGDLEEARYPRRAAVGTELAVKLKQAIKAQKHSRGQTTLIELGRDKSTNHGLDILMPGMVEPISVYVDWWGEVHKMLQVIIAPAEDEDNALYVRFKEDGSIHSIVVDAHHYRLVKPEQSAADDWVLKRDEVKHE